MFELFSWLGQVPYLPEILQFLVAFHAAAVVIVNMTDTPTDNQILAVAYKYIEFAAGIVKASKVKQVSPFDGVDIKADTTPKV